jgi:hypothetical protein
MGPTLSPTVYSSSLASPARHFDHKRPNGRSGRIRHSDSNHRDYSRMVAQSHVILCNLRGRRTQLAPQSFRCKLLPLGSSFTCPGFRLISRLPVHWPTARGRLDSGQQTHFIPNPAKHPLSIVSKCLVIHLGSRIGLRNCRQTHRDSPGGMLPDGWGGGSDLSVPLSIKPDLRFLRHSTHGVYRHLSARRVEYPWPCFLGGTHRIPWCQNNGLRTGRLCGGRRTQCKGLVAATPCGVAGHDGCHSGAFVASLHIKLPGDPVRIFESYILLVQRWVQLHSCVSDTRGR